MNSIGGGCVRIILMAMALSISCVSMADVIPPSVSVAVTGDEANKLAEVLGVRNYTGTMIATGNASLSCVRQKSDSSFTCTIMPSKADRDPASVRKK